MFAFLLRIESMKQVVNGLMGAASRIVAVTCLCLLVFYIYAVLCTASFKHLYEEGHLTEDFFASIDQSFFTLFQILTMDSWSDISKQVNAQIPWAWFVFVSFQLVTSFIVINLVIAVICDSVADLKDEEEEGPDGEITSMKQVQQLEKKIDDMNELIVKLLEQQGAMVGVSYKSKNRS